MMLYNAKIVYPTHQLEQRLLLTLKYTSHIYIVHHPLKIKVCHTMNVIS
ncbi:hypothetical protein F383_00599 [Gossypium arboreum]|uniref:Uncharacterized protein n=1 Tax=Gossypium arboreum TaxID=29729 RepID=A0A0B0PL52_GOSAR|nr:hypothetical protein F383_00599 [Gossypium arboreum]